MLARWMMVGLVAVAAVFVAQEGMSIWGGPTGQDVLIGGADTCSLMPTSYKCQNSGLGSCGDPSLTASATAEGDKTVTQDTSKEVCQTTGNLNCEKKTDFPSKSGCNSTGSP